VKKLAEPAPTEESIKKKDNLLLEQEEEDTKRKLRNIREFI
jgi:hypothetical protein